MDRDVRLTFERDGEDVLVFADGERLLRCDAAVAMEMADQMHRKAEPIVRRRMMAEPVSGGKAGLMPLSGEAA